jgi:hypothetical protein
MNENHQAAPNALEVAPALSATDETLTHVYLGRRHPERKGRPCRPLPRSLRGRGHLPSADWVTVEFADGVQLRVARINVKRISWRTAKWVKP